MIWLAWRQFRTQAAVVFVALIGFALLILLTGHHLRDIYDHSGVSQCLAHPGCSQDSSDALAGHEVVLRQLLGLALLLVPALIGMFWGAPLLAREFEAGTHRLAWTQSVTRTRWLLTKIAIVGLAAVVVAGLASWLVNWWYTPLDTIAMSRFDQSVFTERGIVAIGYTAFAFALGVGFGALLRRTLAAMAATFVSFIAVRIGFTIWVRPNLLAARHVLRSITQGQGFGFIGSPTSINIFAGPPVIPNAWTVSAVLVDRARHALSTAQLHNLLARTCPTIAKGLPHNPGLASKNGPAGSLAGGAFDHCVKLLSHHLQLLVAYQPPGNYWPLQALETGVFVVAGLLLIGVTVWIVGRRAT
jgi:hypothetical protein